MCQHPAVGSDLLAVLSAECELVSAAVLGLAEADFSLPTRCTEWDVKELLAHLYRDLERLPVALALPDPDEADHDFASYWRGYDDNAAIAARAKTRAAPSRS